MDTVYLPYGIIKQLKSLDITLDFPIDNIVMRLYVENDIDAFLSV